jgi:hypothetical protein
MRICDSPIRAVVLHPLQGQPIRYPHVFGYVRMCLQAVMAAFACMTAV